MEALHLAPVLRVDADRLQGCTSPLVRLLWLFSYGRCVSVNRTLRHVIISTRRAWWWRRSRVVAFDEVSRIIYRAQALPALSPLRYLSADAGSDSALFLISLGLKSNQELPLFTVWEEQPRTPDWLDRLAGTAPDEPRLGDESAGHVVELLQSYIGAPLAGD